MFRILPATATKYVCITVFNFFYLSGTTDPITTNRLHLKFEEIRRVKQALYKHNESILYSETDQMSETSCILYIKTIKTLSFSKLLNVLILNNNSHQFLIV